MKFINRKEGLKQREGGKKRELSWIFLLNKAKRFVNLAKSDFLPAAIHLSAILTPKLLISLLFSPSVTVLDSFLMSGYSNIPFFFSSPFHWLTDTCCLLTDRSSHVRHEVSCEWIWMESSIRPSAISLHWHGVLTGLGEQLNRILKWTRCEWGSNVFSKKKNTQKNKTRTNAVRTVAGTFTVYTRSEYNPVQRHDWDLV